MSEKGTEPAEQLSTHTAKQAAARTHFSMSEGRWLCSFQLQFVWKALQKQVAW